MESYNDATYLWGAHVATTVDVEGVTPGYHSFANWGELTSESEATLFAAFWRWLDDVRDACRDAGVTFAAYCFWAQAEDGAMNRAVHEPVGGGPTHADLVAFRSLDPPVWIDLHDVVKRQIQTEGPLGLKGLAMATGFRWRDENPSGEASMQWYEKATSGDEDDSSWRRRILDYNEDDCRATKALRDWLNGPARDLVHRDDLAAIEAPH
jgi:predicted RecB family nuclease